MSEAAATAATGTNAATSAANQAALEELVSGLGLPGDDEPTVPGAPVPKLAAAAGVARAATETEDDLSDLDDPAKPFTAERAQEVKQRLAAARERAREETRKANAASARARAQEERFSRTKEKVLEQKNSVDSERVLIDGIRRALFSGDKNTVLQAIGHISGKDPLEAWKDISLGVAGQRKTMAERDPELLGVIQSLQQEIAGLKGGLTQRDTASQQQAEAVQLEQLRDQLVTEASESTAHLLVSTFAKNEETRAATRTLLDEIKFSEFKKRGHPIDNPTAFGILESRLKAQSELFQQVHAPNGQATDERGTAGPAPGDSAVSRTETAKQAPSPPPRTIPAELSGRSGGTRRALTEAERINEIARQTPASVFREMGLGALLLDGEE